MFFGATFAFTILSQMFLAAFQCWGYRLVLRTSNYEDNTSQKSRDTAPPPHIYHLNTSQSPNGYGVVYPVRWLAVERRERFQLRILGRDS